MEEDLIQQSLADYDAGRYSPRLLTAHELPLDAHVLEPHEDLQRLQLSRQQLQATGRDWPRLGTLSCGGRDGCGQPRLTPLPSQVMRARALRTSSSGVRGRAWGRTRHSSAWRCHWAAAPTCGLTSTGHESLASSTACTRASSVTNTTHYDSDNPPPKIMQGYKFNIFYPDLIRKRATPEYFLEACADNRDFAILRFHAGPPYEDIAFKIVSREWEYSHRHGFRCQFANGIFQLWFHFKRYRYRR